MDMIDLRNVDYTVGGRAILKEVSLSVKEQETLAILGASGSGKSTILRLILGLIQPEKGEVWLFERELSRLPYQELVEIRKNMGIVFQEGALFDSLTVGENVGYYYLEHTSQTHADVAPKVQAMLETVGLGHTIDLMPEQLSGGMRRRVAIARALIYQPKLILYDEPTTGLDPVASRSITDLINQLKIEHKVASVIVTHDMEDALAVADRFIVIQAGRVAWTGTRRQFAKEQSRLVEQFYQTA
jgi:phospholipid/cholesterol/gamma-HCH transport system ATP-binding protein